MVDTLMAAFTISIDPEFSMLSDQLREEAEEVGRRYAAGLCGQDEYRVSLDRFTRLVLYGEKPLDDDHRVR
jgi:hypothetical protein